MKRILRTFAITVACLAILVTPVLADGDNPVPPDTNGDPTDPHGSTMVAPEVVVSDAPLSANLLTWLVMWIVW